METANAMSGRVTIVAYMRLPSRYRDIDFIPSILVCSSSRSSSSSTSSSARCSSFQLQIVSLHLYSSLLYIIKSLKYSYVFIINALVMPRNSIDFCPSSLCVRCPVDPRLLPRFLRLRLHSLGIAPYRPHSGLKPSRCRNRIT